MPYYDLQGGGSPVNNTSTIILTKENNPLKFKAGYYTAFDLTTNVGDMKAKKIVYRHHQCSTSQSNLTYDDGTFNTNGAKSVSNLIVKNGQTVSTVKGGCYTTPYYYCRIHHTGSSYSVPCDGYYIQDGYAGKPNDTGSYPVYRCSKCSYSQVGGRWLGHNRTVKNPDYDTYEYRTSPAGSVSATYYLKSCPYNNGQALSAEITY